MDLGSTGELDRRAALSVEGLSTSLPKSTELRTLGALITMDIPWPLLRLILENGI